jgi:hypothetical protein
VRLLRANGNVMRGLARIGPEPGISLKSCWWCKLLVPEGKGQGQVQVQVQVQVRSTAVVTPPNPSIATKSSTPSAGE